MFRMIVTAVVLVLLAVLIVLNVGNTAGFNLYGLQLTSVPVIVVAILSFVGGILYSFLFSMIRFLDRRRRDGLKARAKKVGEAEARVKAEARAERAPAMDREPAPEPPERKPSTILGRIGSRIKDWIR